MKGIWRCVTRVRYGTPSPTGSAEPRPTAADCSPSPDRARRTTMSSVAWRPSRPQELVRVVDQVSFLYLDKCVVNRDSNAITATDERGTVHIPAASVGVLLLGPGTTITHQAITLLSDSGSTVV